MRTRGHSFVILTIAFLFVMQLLALNWTELTYGNRGLSLPLPTWPREWGNLPFYYIFLGLLAPHDRDRAGGSGGRSSAWA